MLLNELKRPIPLAKMETEMLQIGVELLRNLTVRLREYYPDVILALAGGCVRDQLNALEPKDIDLVVIGAVPFNAETHERGTEAVLYDLITYYGYDQVEHFNRDMADSYATRFPGDEDRFDAIVKYESRRILAGEDDLQFLAGNGFPLDVLFYNERYKNIADIAASHDHSINQFAAWIDEAGKLQWKYFGDVDGWGYCMQIRNGVTDERRARVAQICSAIGWAYAGDL